jgi:HAD superfamily hydrolase (TIGR01509 family)
MIRAMIFDLDGTLVQTERLKAHSYATAILELCPEELQETEVLGFFKSVVGRSRKEVAEALVDRFNLWEQAERKRAEFDVPTAWQAFVQVRLQHYDKMLSDPQVIRESQWPHNRAVLEQARQVGCATGLATMSHCEQTQRVLSTMDLQHAFDFIATRDDVECGKPDPEIYYLVSDQLKVRSAECLVLEDSPAGIQAAIAAGMHCVAVTTPFTQEAVHSSGILEERWIVDDPGRVADVIREKFESLQGDRG